MQRPLEFSYSTVFQYNILMWIFYMTIVLINFDKLGTWIALASYLVVREIEAQS